MKRFTKNLIAAIMVFCMIFGAVSIAATAPETQVFAAEQVSENTDNSEKDTDIASNDGQNDNSDAATEDGTPADDNAEEEEPAPDPVLSQTKLTVELGKRVKLTVTGNVGKVKWSSKNPEIAKVTKFGRVIGKSEGKTYVYATVDGKTLKCKVTVKEAKYVDIIAVGDNLYHQSLVKSGLQSDGTYNYDRIYSGIKDYIQYADVRIINQETVLISDKSQWSYQPSAFGTPTQVGDAVVKAGFNVITTASNHSLDKGTEGIKSAVKYWKKQAKNDVLMVGMYDSQADYNNIAISEYNGVKIAFLNYTYGLNGRTLPSGNSYMVKLLKESLIKQEIEAARKKADVVIVLPHWGEEYHYQPTSSQKSLAQKMADWGADIIIGAHPHVLEPMVTLTASDGRKVPCYYSLGNFCANMPIMHGNVNCALEGMAELRIKVMGGKVSIEKAELTPLVIHINTADTKFIVYRLEDYTAELMKAHFSNRNDPATITVSGLWKLYRGICDGTAKSKFD